MATTAPLRNRIQKLKKQYDSLKQGKESLLQILNEVEVAESVYNSNAIENSTLTLKETEKILLEMEVSRNVSLREVFEAKNLARVMQYVEQKVSVDTLSKEMILLLHQMLISNIEEDIAGRLRTKGEYVRVGTYIAPSPERVEALMENLLVSYSGDVSAFFSDKIAAFHLEFERIHPFNDGNGRIGRVLMNFQFLQYGFPSVIIRNKEKKDYYKAFKVYDETSNSKNMEKIIAMALMESLHKRITYLEGKEVVFLSSYAKKMNQSAPSIYNAASRQTLPAFREKGVWKIGI
jgi:Fic family protein